jgi:hypothetical protein
MSRTYKPGHPVLRTSLADYINFYNSEINAKPRTPVRSFEDATVYRGLYSHSKKLSYLYSIENQS